MGPALVVNGKGAAMAEPEFRDYECTYSYDGTDWGIVVRATSVEDAQARLRRMAWGRVEGVIALKIWAGPGGIFAPILFPVVVAISRFCNRFRGGTVNVVKDDDA